MIRPSLIAAVAAPLHAVATAVAVAAVAVAVAAVARAAAVVRAVWLQPIEPGLRESHSSFARQHESGLRDKVAE
jgi:hypothetical protein